jgi:pyruvate/2-oxoglutarate dehydrogenase complex dihydrolipoamide acyltransferase (E2) component
MTVMSFRYVCIALLALALVGCDVGTAVSLAPAPAPGQSAPGAASAPAATAAGATVAPGVTPTPAPIDTPQPTVARTAPPAPPPTPAPAPKIAAVPSTGVRGTNFVFQLTGFPKSANGLDILQTVTTPAGKPVGPAPFTTRPDGTGLTTFSVTSNYPTGLYFIKITAANGSFSAQTTFQVN